MSPRGPKNALNLSQYSDKMAQPGWAAAEDAALQINLPDKRERSLHFADALGL